MLVDEEDAAEIVDNDLREESQIVEEIARGAQTLKDIKRRRRSFLGLISLSEMFEFPLFRKYFDS